MRPLYWLSAYARFLRRHENATLVIACVVTFYLVLFAWVQHGGGVDWLACVKAALCSADTHNEDIDRQIREDAAEAAEAFARLKQGPPGGQ